MVNVLTDVHILAFRTVLQRWPWWTRPRHSAM